MTTQRNTSMVPSSTGESCVCFCSAVELCLLRCSARHNANASNGTLCVWAYAFVVIHFSTFLLSGPASGETGNWIRSSSIIIVLFSQRYMSGWWNASIVPCLPVQLGGMYQLFCVCSGGVSEMDSGSFSPYQNQVALLCS